MSFSPSSSDTVYLFSLPSVPFLPHAYEKFMPPCLSVCPTHFRALGGGGHVMFGTIGSAFEGHGSPPSVDMWIVHACRMNIELYTLYEYCLDFQKRYCWRSSIQRLSVGAHSEFQYFTGMPISIQSRCNLTFLFHAQFSIPSSRRIGARLSMVAYSRNV